VEIPSAIFSEIVARIETGVYALNRERKVVYWNHGAEQITGYLRQEVLGREYRKDLVVENEEHCPLVCVHPCPLEGPPEADWPQRIMTYLRHKAGHVVPVLLWTLSLKDAAGQIVGSVKIFSEQLTALEPRHAGSSANSAENQDADTGLPDRATVEAFLRAQCEVANQTKAPCGMIAIQVAFEDFRQAHGQAAAGALMREVGCTLQEMIRGTDLVGRWCENYFVAVLPDCGAVVLERVAGRMKRISGRVAIPWTGDRLSTAVEVRTGLIAPGGSVDALLARLFSPPTTEDKQETGSFSAGD
jgi:PAS domain S-box-containing protein